MGNIKAYSSVVVTDLSDGIISSNVIWYYLSTSATSLSGGSWKTTPDAWVDGKYFWQKIITTYEDGHSTESEPVCITGKTGASGISSTNIILSNEAHTFFANSSGKATATSITTDVLAFTGQTQVSAKIGTISGLPTGMTMTINNNNTVNASIAIAVTTSLTTTQGVVTIPVTASGITINKKFSYCLSKTGATGATGTAAKSVVITASSQIFKSTDGGLTFSPDTITLTPIFQGGISYSKWQYSTDGGSNWKDVTSGSNGLTISNEVLTITKSSALYTDTITSVSFKCISSDSTYFDIITILRLYDVTDIRVGGRNLLIVANMLATYLNEKTGLPYNTNAGISTINNNGDTCTKDYISVEGGCQYVLTLYDNRPDAGSQYGRIAWFDGDHTLIEVTTDKINWTVPTSKVYMSPSNAAFVMISIVAFPKYRWKFEKGNIPTDYTPAPEDIKNQITAITNTIAGVESKVDANTKSITDKVWQSDITSSINNYDNTTGKAIRDRVTQTEANVSGLTTTVSDVQSTLINKADGSTVEALQKTVTKNKQSADSFQQTVTNTYAKKSDVESSISSVSSQYTQLADKFSWVVSSGTSQSNMTLTDKMYQLIATDINMGGRVTFSSLTDDNGTTMINGGKVLAKYLELKGITIYSNETYIDDEGNTQNVKTFSVDENGNVSINAASLTLTAGALATANDINNINSRLDNQDSDLAALESNISSDIARLDEDINGESGLHSQIANLQIANSEIVMNFGTLESDVDGLTGTINSTSEVWKKYIKIVDGAMIFGRHINDDGTEISEADQTSLKLENTSLSFSQDGSTVAQMTSKELYIRNAVITEGLKVASYIIKPRETGGVAFYKM